MNLYLLLYPMKQLGLLCFLLVIFCHKAFAQQWQRHDNTTHYSYHNGLNNTYINDIVEDKYGIFWIATYDGVVRFDGRHFLLVSKKFPKPNEIKTGYAYRLKIIDNSLWVTGSVTARMNLNTHVWETFLLIFSDTSSIEINESFQVFKDSKNQIWLTTPYLGLCKFNPTKNRFEYINTKTDYSSKKYDWIMQIFENKKGEIIFTESKGIVVLKDNKELKTIPWPIQQKHPFRNSNFWYQDDKIWVSIDQYGIFQYDFLNKKWSETKIKEDNKFSAFPTWTIPRISYKKLESGNLLVQNFPDLEFDMKNNLFIRTKLKSLIPHLSNVQFLSKNNDLWIGTSNGLYRSPQNNIVLKEYIDLAHVPISQYIVGYDEKNQTLGFIQNYNSSILYQLDKFGVKTRKLSQADIFTTRMHFYEDKVFFTGKFRCVITHNNKLKQVSSIPAHTNRFRYYISDRRNEKVVVSGFQKNLYLYDLVTDSCIRILSFKEILNDQVAVFAKFLPNGNILASCELANYIEEFGPNGKLVRKTYLPTNTITSIYRMNSFCISKNSIVWFSIYNKGIVEFNLNTKEIRNHYEANNFDLINCTHILYDNDKHVWAYSNEGIYCINTDTRAKQRVDNKLNIKLNLNDGFLFNYKNGEVIYSIFDKLYILNPGYNSFKQTPYLYFEDLRVMGNASYQNIFSEQSIVLNPGENTFEFKIGLVSFNQSPVSYFWKMEGLNDNWISLSTPIFSYIGIKPGRYIIQIKATSPEKSFDDTIRTIELVVKPKWFQTWWFKFSIALLLLLAIWYVLRLNIKNKLQKQKAEIEKKLALEKERNRIARDMHDDLGAGLSKIKYLSDEALLNTESENTKRLLMLNKQNSDELVDKMNDIIWTLNNKDETLEDLIIKMRSNFGQWLFEMEKILILSVEEFNTDIHLDEFKKRNVFLAVKEAINNSVKYAGTKEVFLNIEQIGRELVIQIKDKGVGFDVEKMKLKGNGLSNFHKRLNEINGSVSIQSDEHGTTVKFTIPV